MVSEGSQASCRTAEPGQLLQVALGLHILRFPEALEDTLQDLLPNRLTDFVYELADRFTKFYMNCQVTAPTPACKEAGLL